MTGVSDVSGDPRVVEVGEVTDTRDPAQGDLFYYGTTFTEAAVWPGTNTRCVYSCVVHLL